MKATALALLLLGSVSSGWLGAKVRTARAPFSGGSSTFRYARPLTVVNASGNALSSFQVAASTDVYPTTFDTADASLKALWHFEEGAGTSTADSSGNGIAGTLTVGAGGSQTTAEQAWSDGANGRMGRSLAFDGTDDMLSGSAASFPTGSANRSVEVWFNRASQPVSQGPLFGYGGDGTTNASYTIYTRDDDKVCFSQWGGALCSTVSISSGRWYHLAVTNVGSTVSLYLNGALEATGTLTINTTAGSSFYIGKATVNEATRRFSGQIDEVRVWSRALNAQEIYDHARLVYGLNAGLVGSWHFSEGTGSSAADTSGNAFTGSLLGGATWAANGKFGKGVTLNGAAGSYVSIADRAAIRTTGAMTFAGWFNWSNNEANWLFGKMDGALANGWYVYSDAPRLWTLTFVIYVSSTRYEWQTSFKPANGVWYHLAITFSPGVGAWLYLNGAATAWTYVPAIPSSIGSNTTALGLGQYVGGGGYNFAGTMDEVRLYHRTLSAAEVAELASESPKVRPDLQDLRVSTTLDGTGEIPFWLESDKQAWVKVPNLPTGTTTLYQFYGNASATLSTRAACLSPPQDGSGYAHCGQNVFDLYDDFESGNMSAWSSPGTWSASTTQPAQGSYSAYAAGAPSVLSTSMGTPLVGAVTELWVKPVTTTAYVYPVFNPMYTLVGTAGGGWQYYTGASYANLPVSTTFTMNNWYDIRIREDIANDRYQLSINGAEKGWITNNAQFNAAANISGFSALNAQSGMTGTMYLDLVRVRKLASVEPHSWAGTEFSPAF